MSVFDINKLSAACSGFLSALKSEINKALEDTAESINSDIKSDTSFGGTKLRNSFLIRKSGKYKYSISSKAHNAGFIEYGTRPHQIRPKNKKFLRFVARDGSIVFTKLVNHPGNKAYKFFERATNKAVRTLRRKLNTALRHAAQRWR